MAEGKKKRISRRQLTKEIHELARTLADKRERMRLVRYKIEKRAKSASDMRERVRMLRVHALEVPDSIERARAIAELERLEKETDDNMFMIAELRSEARRANKHIEKLDAMLAVVRVLADKGVHLQRERAFH